MKWCTKCGELKSETEFYPAKGCKDGLRGDCKACHKVRTKLWHQQNRDKSIAKTRKWQQNNPDKMREYRLRTREARAVQMRKLHLRRNFGMTLDDYSAVLGAQEGGCAICGDKPDEGQSFHIDRNDNGVRGILCVRCNNALGQLKDDPELMLRAAEYTKLGGFAPLWLVRPESTGTAS